MYKIDGSELYEYQQQLLQPPEDIPIWEKKCLTVEEAAAYSGIGERRLKALLMDKDCSFRIARSDRLLIIREKLEEFIDSKVKECVAVPKSKKLLQFTLDDGTGTDRTILSGIHAYYEPEELVGKTLIAITNLPPRKMMGIESCGMLLSAVNNLKDSEDEELHLIMVDNHIPAGAKLY